MTGIGFISITKLFAFSAPNCRTHFLRSEDGHAQERSKLSQVLVESSKKDISLFESINAYLDTKF